jgi:hypothetical protein
MVQLIDLWVASLLPGDVFDLMFEIVACTADGETAGVAALEGLRFAQGFLVIATRELWWDGPRTGTPHGLRVQSIAVRDQAQPIPKPSGAALPSVTLAHLARVLPHAVAAYPSVEWRSAPDDSARSPLHAYLLALGLLCTACGSGAPGSQPTVTSGHDATPEVHPPAARVPLPGRDPRGPRSPRST